MINKDIVAEGARHFREHKNYKNPYELGSDEFNDFERGWVQALKRADLANATSYLRSWSRHEEP